MKTRAFTFLLMLDFLCTALFAVSFIPPKKQILTLSGFRATTITSGLDQVELAKLNKLVSGLEAELTYPSQFDLLTAKQITLRLYQTSSAVKADGYAFFLRLEGAYAEYDPPGEVIVPLRESGSVYVEWQITSLQGEAESATLWVSLANPLILKNNVLLRAIPLRFTARRVLVLPVGVYRLLSGALMLLTSAALVRVLVGKRRML